MNLIDSNPNFSSFFLVFSIPHITTLSAIVLGMGTLINLVRQQGRGGGGGGDEELLSEEEEKNTNNSPTFESKLEPNVHPADAFIFGQEYYRAMSRRGGFSIVCARYVSI